MTDFWFPVWSYHQTLESIDPKVYVLSQVGLVILKIKMKTGDIRVFA